MVTHAAGRAGLPVMALLLALAVFPGAGVAEPADTYKLPWDAGTPFMVVQGNYRLDPTDKVCVSGCYSHKTSEHFAWDFALPERTTVRAARAGRVAFVRPDWKDANHCGGYSSIANPPPYFIVSNNIGNEGNYVVIDHGDGTSALYLHLVEVSSSVKQKLAAHDTVAQGEMLGLSGKTGYTRCNPHLHFQVQRTGAIWYQPSVAIRFADRDVVARASDGVPVQGQTYTSDNTASAASPPNSSPPAPSPTKADWSGLAGRWSGPDNEMQIKADGTGTLTVVCATPGTVRGTCSGELIHASFRFTARTPTTVTAQVTKTDASQISGTIRFQREAGPPQVLTLSLEAGWYFCREDDPRPQGFECS